ncbi:MAG TPA: ATP-dependent helicase, partial [bacterium]|nr:ATP-dependent helicase [bacterium]
PQQEQVVTEAEGPCLVLGGPGCGKTQVLIHRIAYLLHRGVPAGSMMLLTPSRQSAEEMRCQVAELTGFFPHHLQAGTFFQIAAALLRRFGKAIGLESDFTILDQEESLALLHAVVGPFIRGENFPSTGSVAEIISYSINTQEGLRQTVNVHYPQWCSFLSLLETVQSEYFRRKRALKVLDGDDLLLFWYRLSRSDEAGNQLSELYRYLLVDDYQNVNKLESLILYQMSRKHWQILVTADDAQAISGFRGGSLNHILDFPRLYPKAKVFSLTTNYRSTPEILSLARAILSRNHVQFPRKIVCQRKTGVKPVLVKCRRPREEATFVAQRVEQLLRSGVHPEEIAILYRYRSQATRLEFELNRRLIAYYVDDERYFPGRETCRDILAYLRVAVNPGDVPAWQRLLSITEGLGKATREKILEEVQNINSREIMDRLKQRRFSPRCDCRVKFLLKTLEGLRQKKEIPGMIDLILSAGYREYLNRNYGQAPAREETLDKLKEFSLTCPSLIEFLTELSLPDNPGFLQPQAEGRITLSSIYQGRGKQWPIVFIIGLSQPFFPGPAAAADIAFLEEQRRFFYVAVTRAREDLYLCWYPSFQGKARVSPLVKEIESAELERWSYEGK